MARIIGAAKHHLAAFSLKALRPHMQPKTYVQETCVSSSSSFFHGNPLAWSQVSGKQGLLVHCRCRPAPYHEHSRKSQKCRRHSGHGKSSDAGTQRHLGSFDCSMVVSATCATMDVVSVEMPPTPMCTRTDDTISIGVAHRKIGWTSLHGDLWIVTRATCVASGCGPLHVIAVDTPRAAISTRTDHTVSIVVTYGKIGWTSPWTCMVLRTACAAMDVVAVVTPWAAICTRTDHAVSIIVAYRKLGWTSEESTGLDRQTSQLCLFRGFIQWYSPWSNVSASPSCHASHWIRHFNQVLRLQHLSQRYSSWSNVSPCPSCEANQRIGGTCTCECGKDAEQGHASAQRN